MDSELAIEFVKRTLSTGDYGYTLRKYINIDTWNHLFLDNMTGIKFVQMTDFNYSRCFSYYFMEDIDLKHDFFSSEAKEQVIAKGGIEFINVSISAISSFYIIEKAKYVAEGNQLKIRNIDKFENPILESKMTELEARIEGERFIQVSSKELRIPLNDVPLEDYESEDITYFSYLFE